MPLKEKKKKKPYDRPELLQDFGQIRDMVETIKDKMAKDKQEHQREIKKLKDQNALMEEAFYARELREFCGRYRLKIISMFSPNRMPKNLISFSEYVCALLDSEEELPPSIKSQIPAGLSNNEMSDCVEFAFNWYKDLSENVIHFSQLPNFQEESHDENVRKAFKFYSRGMLNVDKDVMKVLRKKMYKLLA